MIERCGSVLLAMACVGWSWQPAVALVVSEPDGSEIVTGQRAVAVPGMPAPLDVTGVGRITTLFGEVCTGSLMPSGRHVLTAAHCVHQYAGTSYMGWNAVGFQGAAGESFEARWASVLVHPAYRPELGVLGGYDLALIELDREVPGELATRYAPGAGTLSGPVDVVKAGYGYSGNGATGVSGLDALLRVGVNRYEGMLGGVLRDFFADEFNVADTDDGSLAVYDFDSGGVSEDAYTAAVLVAGEVPVADLGHGAREAMAAPGDSGGPAFVYDIATGEYVVAGVSAGVFRTEGDLDGMLNSSWGELGVDAWLGNSTDWMAGSTALVPEPGVGALMLAGGLAAGRRRRIN